MKLQIVVLILWLFAGIWNLAKPFKITKLDYALIWVVLILNLVYRIFNS